jgi:predicted dehydrogenase
VIRAAVIGAGSFGRNHIRVLSQLPGVELAAIVDVDLSRAQQLAQEYHSQAMAALDPWAGRIEAAIIATPTETHEAIAAQLLEAGIDVLIEKPVAETSAAAERLARLADDRGRILQAGHLERFNPAVRALEQALTVPLFFEVHRLSVFTPRSLDIDVVLDLMIHDLDIVLSFAGAMPEEVRAAGISVLSNKVDIANVRLSFASGCIANLTASRISVEQVRKLRLFQPGEYISLDYQRQDATRFAIRKNEPQIGFVPQIGFEPLAVTPGEPLQLELAAFFAAVHERSRPRVDVWQASRALRVAESILAKIREHADLVSETIRAAGQLSDS